MGNDEMKEIFREFDSLAIKERIDAAVSLIERYNANAASEVIKIAPINRIQIEDGIEMAAVAVGVELQQFTGTGGGILYNFQYKDHEFSQYSFPTLEGAET